MLSEILAENSWRPGLFVPTSVRTKYLVDDLKLPTSNPVLAARTAYPRRLLDIHSIQIPKLHHHARPSTQTLRRRGIRRQNDEGGESTHRQTNLQPLPQKGTKPPALPTSPLVPKANKSLTKSTSFFPPPNSISNPVKITSFRIPIRRCARATWCE